MKLMIKKPDQSCSFISAQLRNLIQILKITQSTHQYRRHEPGAWELVCAADWARGRGLTCWGSRSCGADRTRTWRAWPGCSARPHCRCCSLGPAWPSSVSLGWSQYRGSGPPCQGGTLRPDLCRRCVSVSQLFHVFLMFSGIQSSGCETWGSGQFALNPCWTICQI